MNLTPTLKVLLVGFAFLSNVMLWIWTGIQTDALAIGLNEHVYNIVLVVISGAVTSGSAVLGYLGLRAPELPPKG